MTIHGPQPRNVIMFVSELVSRSLEHGIHVRHADCFIMHRIIYIHDGVVGVGDLSVMLIWSRLLIICCCQKFANHRSRFVCRRSTIRHLYYGYFLVLPVSMIFLSSLFICLIKYLDDSGLDICGVYYIAGWKSTSAAPFWKIALISPWFDGEHPKVFL